MLNKYLLKELVQHITSSLFTSYFHVYVLAPPAALEYNQQKLTQVMCEIVKKEGDNFWEANCLADGVGD